MSPLTRVRILTKQKIIKDWTDYNGHMNVAYYVWIFDQIGSEVLLTKFNMGEHSARTTKKSTMVVESHITYNQEVKEGDNVDVNLIYCDHDKKRIQYRLEMIHSEKKYLAATLEALSLYVDLDERKVVEFEKEINSFSNVSLEACYKSYLYIRSKF